MKITIKTKHIILFFILLCVVLLIFKLFEENCEICEKTFLNGSFPKVISCSYSTGESMNFPDDVLHLYGKPENISVGDIIVFNNLKKKDHTIIHRVIEIEEIDGVIYYTSKGDNNWISDEPITIKQIKYKVLKTLYFDTDVGLG